MPSELATVLVQEEEQQDNEARDLELRDTPKGLGKRVRRRRR